MRSLNTNKTALIILFSVISLHSLFCQIKWQSGIFLGGANYQGDLIDKQTPDFSQTGFAIGIINRYQISSNFSLRNHIMFGKIQGTDLNASAKRQKRNFSFENNLGEFGLAMEWTPRILVNDSVQIPTLQPYMYGGLGFFRSSLNNSFDTEFGNGFLSKIEADKAAIAENNSGLAIPIGGGVKINLSQTFVMGLEVGARMTFSDYIDGVSLSGNPDANDWYWFSGLSVGLRFKPKDSDRDGVIDKEDECPKEKGTLRTRGCPDADGDGVGDAKDTCPEVFGELRYNGCPDSDGDAIVDVLDDCPDFPGPENTNGCPDEDGDRIPDTDDECPRLAGNLYGKGCPPIDLNGNGRIDDEIANSMVPNAPLVDDLLEVRNLYWWVKQSDIFLIFGQ